MSKDCPQYRIHFRTDDAAGDQIAKAGPFDYRQNAINKRNEIFAKFPNIWRCWITKEHVPTGKVLRR